MFQSDQPVLFVAFFPDGKKVLTGSTGKAELWNVDASPHGSGQSGTPILSFGNPANSVGCSPDGKKVMAAGGMWASLWDAATGNLIRRIEPPIPGPNMPPISKLNIASATLSPDGKQLLVACPYAAILWNVASGEKTCQLKLSQGDEFFSAAFSPDANQVLTGMLSGSAILWNAATGKQIRSFRAGALYDHSVAFSPDGKQFLTSSITTAVLRDASSGNEIRNFKGHSGVVTSFAFSPDGKRLLTGSFDDTARLWNSSHFSRFFSRRQICAYRQS